jgi:hypothetical protein
MTRQAALGRLEWQMTQLRTDLQTAARYASEDAALPGELAAIVPLSFVVAIALSGWRPFQSLRGVPGRAIVRALGVSALCRQGRNGSAVTLPHAPLRGCKGDQLTKRRIPR